MAKQNDRVRARSIRRRCLGCGLAAVLVAALSLPFIAYVSDATVVAASSAAEEQTNPRANYWRAVRGGGEGYTAASGPYTTNTLIQNGGQNWRQIRNGPVASVLPWVLALVILAIGAYHILHGPNELTRRPTGRVVPRWTLAERVLHWYTAVLFIVLAITGLSLLFGRAVLIPVIGLNGFSAWASLSIGLHNYLGPFFLVGMLLEIVVWLKYNILHDYDWTWLKNGGGYLWRTAHHPPAHRINAGEKILTFWMGLVVLGTLVAITGLIMDFPNVGWSRQTMQISNVIHGVAAIIWIALILGHIYLGTVGVPGTLQAMTQGNVTAEWAQEHHDLWYEELRRRGIAEEEMPAGETGRGPTRPRVPGT